MLDEGAASARGRPTATAPATVPELRWRRPFTGVGGADRGAGWTDLGFAPRAAGGHRRIRSGRRVAWRRRHLDGHLGNRPVWGEHLDRTVNGCGRLRTSSRCPAWPKASRRGTCRWTWWRPWRRWRPRRAMPRCVRHRRIGVCARRVSWQHGIEPRRKQRQRQRPRQRHRRKPGEPGTRCRPRLRRVIPTRAIKGSLGRRSGTSSAARCGSTTRDVRCGLRSPRTTTPWRSRCSLAGYRRERGSENERAKESRRRRDRDGRLGSLTRSGTRPTTSDCTTRCWTCFERGAGRVRAAVRRVGPAERRSGPGSSCTRRSSCSSAVQPTAWPRSPGWAPYRLRSSGGSPAMPMWISRWRTARGPSSIRGGCGEIRLWCSGWRSTGGTRGVGSRGAPTPSSRTSITSSTGSMVA